MTAERVEKRFPKSERELSDLCKLLHLDMQIEADGVPNVHYCSFSTLYVPCKYAGIKADLFLCCKKTMEKYDRSRE